MTMQHQREGLLLPEATQTPDDLHVYEAFKAAHLDTTEVYRQMSLEGEQKQRALVALRAGEDADFSVPESPDEVPLDSRIAVLKDWKRELIADPSIDPDIKQAYRWKVNEDIANLYMLQASREGNMSAFRRWNKYIYGEPDEMIYRGALDWVAADAEQIIASSDKSFAIESAQKVLALLEGQRGYRELLAPDEETFAAVREDHLREGGYYALLLDGVTLPHDGKITNEVGDAALRHVLRNNLQSDYEIVDAPGAAWSVVHSRSEVERPKTYNMPAKRFVGLGVGHEIGRHLLERVNGLRGPVRLAAGGLDRTEKGNEGRAIVSEIVPYESFDEFGKLVRWRDILRRDIAIGYAWGIGQDEPRTSKETYAFMNAIDTMYQAKLTGQDASETQDKAHKKTGDLLARVLRGVDGAKGGAYLKDKVYLEGHVATWLTAAQKGAQSISEGDLGKFDINNPRHIALLQNKGLLPKEPL